MHELESSPPDILVPKVWKSDLYRLQEEAPRAVPVPAEGPVPGRPSHYGLEFHGVLSSLDACRLLKDDGSYLVRCSAGNDGFYTLSIRFNGKVSHYRLYFDGQHYLRDKRYECVHDLVSDGLIILYLEQHASHYIEQIHLLSYEQSPYMTLNGLKRRAVKTQTYKKKENSVNGFLENERQNEFNEATEKAPETAPVPELDDIKNHVFRTHTFKGLTWCEFCGHFLWGFTAQGVKCEDCGFSAHSRCSEKVPPDCRPDLKTMRGVFGLDLTLVTRAQRSPRPWVVDRCIAEIERRGLTSEGLYRVSGFQDEIASLKLALDKDGEQAEMGPAAYDNINVIAGTLKLYLRLLPIPLITFDAHAALMAANQASTLEEKLKGLQNGLTLLPTAHYSTLKYFVEHLYRVAQLSEVNRMTANNLSTVLAPTLMPMPDLTQCGGAFPAMTNEISAVAMIIIHHKSVFK